jgi:hypothetical protein
MMRKSHFILGPVLVLLLSGATSAQSLADVARAEEARRKTIKSKGKVYTNDTLRGPDGGEAPAPPPPSATTPASGGDKAAPQPAPSTTPAAPDRSNDEKYWRDRISAARTELQRTQAFHDALQSQVQGLYTEFVATDDPAQRALVEKKRLAALAEQERVKSEIAKRTQAIADIEEEARRANVPAGWLR